MVDKFSTLLDQCSVGGCVQVHMEENVPYGRRIGLFVRNHREEEDITRCEGQVRMWDIGEALTYRAHQHRNRSK